MIVDRNNGKILATDYVKGSQHDFSQLKEMKLKISDEKLVIADSGYQGLKNLYKNSILPIKNTKLHPLTDEQKEYNKNLSTRRVLVENVIGVIKRFRIVAEKYRNRRRRFDLRFNLFAGIYNYEVCG